MDELWDQTKGMYVPGQEVEPKVYPKQIAFNVIPHIDVFIEDGSTKEEWKMVAETKKIVDPAIKLTATCVRVPVFVGHSEAINIEFEEFLDEDEARDILREAPGIMVVDKREDGGYVTPVECVGDFATFISRIRQDSTIENGLNLWCVVRQPAQGRGAQRRADRRAAGPARAAEGLIPGRAPRAGDGCAGRGSCLRRGGARSGRRDESRPAAAPAARSCRGRGRSRARAGRDARPAPRRRGPSGGWCSTRPGSGG